MKAIRTIFLIAALLCTGVLLPSSAAPGVSSCHNGAPAAMESSCDCCRPAISSRTSLASTCLCEAPARGGDDGIATGRTVSLDLSPWVPVGTRASIATAPAEPGIKSAGEPASPAQPIYILLRRFLS